MCSYVFIGASLGSVVKSMPAMQVTQEMWVQSLGWEDPLEEEMATHSSILAWESHGQRILVGYSLQVTQEMWVQSLGWEDPLEEEMATHFSILAWESHGQRSLVGYSPWGCKELDTTEHTHTIGLLIFLIYEWLSNHDLLIFLN